MNYNWFFSQLAPLVVANPPEMTLHFQSLIYATEPQTRRLPTHEPVPETLLVRRRQDRGVTVEDEDGQLLCRL